LTWAPVCARAVGAGRCSCDPRCRRVSRAGAGGDRACVCSRAVVFLLVAAELQSVAQREHLRTVLPLSSPRRRHCALPEDSLPTVPDTLQQYLRLWHVPTDRAIHLTTRHAFAKRADIALVLVPFLVGPHLSRRMARRMKEIRASRVVRLTPRIATDIHQL